MRNVYTVCGHVVEIDSALNKSDKEHRIKVNDQLLRVRSQARAR